MTGTKADGTHMVGNGFRMLKDDGFPKPHTSERLEATSSFHEIPRRPYDNGDRPLTLMLVHVSSSSGQGTRLQRQGISLRNKDVDRLIPTNTN